MATSLLALIDDIASVLDDVSVLTKVAAKKTASVLGDDLALNAEQVRGVNADRELPVVWAVFKGSLINKLILVPTALLISALAPWAILPLLMLGGLYLCFEGVEKLAHAFLHKEAQAAAHAALTAALEDPNSDLAALERDKIKGAVRTDFILSAEIVVITLGTVETASFMTQVLVLSGIGLLMTIGVYGLVAGIVKLDDAGLYLSRRAGQTAAHQIQRLIGGLLLGTAPLLMKVLSVLGTVAMFLVGGGIITHGVPLLHDWVHHLAETVGTLPALGGLLSVITPLLVDVIIGLGAGILVLLAVERFHKNDTAGAH